MLFLITPTRVHVFNLMGSVVSILLELSLGYAKIGLNPSIPMNYTPES